MKTCPACKLSMESTNFGVDQRTSDGLTCWCKSCRRSKQKASRSARTFTEEQRQTRRECNRRFHDKMRADGVLKDYWRNKSREYLYGITRADYDAILLSQGNACGACGVKHDPSKKLGELHVDHDHVTGRVRGLLCRCCNRALGMLGDDPVGAVRALERYAGRVSPERMALRCLP